MLVIRAHQGEYQIFTIPIMLEPILCRSLHVAASRLMFFFLSVRLSVPVGFDGAWLIVTYGTYCHREYVETSLVGDVAFVF